MNIYFFEVLRVDYGAVDKVKAVMDSLVIKGF